jgi:hypothetical protein
LLGAAVAFYRHRARRSASPPADDVAALAERIRGKIDAGLLPPQPPKSLQAGRGDGSTCSACDRPIPRDDHEWSFWSGGVLTHRFHVACHRLWEAECRKRGWRDRRPRRNSSGRENA